MPSGNGHFKEDYARDVIEEVAKKVGPKAVFGDPAIIGDVAVIPVASVQYGGGGGQGSGSGTGPAGEGADESTEMGTGYGEGQGFGFGAQARPVGTIEIIGGEVIYKPLIDYTRLAIIWSWISGVALLLFVARLLFSGRD